MIDVYAGQLRAAVFDFDGVLGDTIKTHEQARRAAFLQQYEDTGDERWNTPDTLHDQAHKHGSHPAEIIGWILRQQKLMNLTDDPGHPALQAVVAQKRRLYTLACREGVPTVEGAPHLVAQAAARFGGRLAIATTAHAATEVRPYLVRYGLGDYIPSNRIIDADATGPDRLKPDPLAYQMAIARLGIEPHEALAVEDSPRGVMSARAAGMITAACTTTHSIEDFAAMPEGQQPHGVFASFDELASAAGLV